MTTIDHQQPVMADKGLKGGTLGIVAVIVIGVASTAPGYSLAASIGLITGEVGVKAPFISRIRQTVRKIVPMMTWNPWKPVAMKKAEP